MDQIEDPVICEDPSELDLVRQVGFDLPPFHNGTYIVDGVSGCKVFLNTDSEVYITFSSGDTAYYINGADESETRNVFEALSVNQPTT